MGNKVRVTLEREEAIACAIALTRVERPYGWQQGALAKINKALGRKPAKPMQQR